MPTYEYECGKCERVHEVFQSITAEPVKKCPDASCGGKVRRLLGSGAGFLFKGSGFYITDYRSKGYQDAAKKAETAASETKKESKPTQKESKPAQVDNA